MGEEGDEMGVDLVDRGDGYLGRVVLGYEGGEDVEEGCDEAVCDVECYTEGDEDCDVESEREEDEVMDGAVAGDEGFEDCGNGEVSEAWGGAICGGGVGGYS